MLKKQIAIIVLFCLSFMAFAVYDAEAASSNIKISVKEGFDGKIKSGRGFPVQVTVENNGEDFSGDLLFNFGVTYNSSGAKVLSIDVPKGSKKTYSLSLPAYSEEFYNSKQIKQSIFLYKGSWKDGKETAFVGKKILSPKYIDPAGRTMGLLSENPDRLKELKVQASGSQLEPIVLEEEMLPYDELGLDTLDYIVIDEFAVAKLKETQQQALLNWVKNGGRLIVGATPNAIGSYGALYRELPMKPEREAVADTQFLKAPETLEFNTLPVFVGEVKPEANVSATSGDLPMIVHKGYGAGEIWQTAFSLGDEPLASWNYYGRWFAQSPMLGVQMNNQSPKMYQNQFEMLYNEFAEVNQYFASTQFSAGQISLFLLLYLLLISPILYFTLKRLDKREHAWWVIIGFAVLSSIGIFAVGAKDRIAKPQINQTGIYQAENGYLTGLEAVTFLSNTGGDYELTFSKGTFYGVPGSSMMSAGDGKRYAILENARKESKVTFPNVEYWSTRSFFGRASKQNAGKFDLNLSLKNKQLSGTIANQFPYDFDELFIWSGTKKLSLGPLKSGETVTVNETLQQDYLTGPYNQMFQYMMPASPNDVKRLKQERMEYGAIEFLYNSSSLGNQPILYGFSKASVIEADIAAKKEAKNGLSLIYQPMDIKTELSGSFTVKDDMLRRKIHIIRGTLFNDMGGVQNEMEMDDGEYEYVLQVPKQLTEQKPILRELEIVWYGSNVAYSIKNQATGEFLPLPDMKTAITEQLEQYISNEGEIVIKLIKTGQGDPRVRMPALSIKGEINS
ncbi:hypothetical protein [Neobacillus niacini]|uniref:hypothetical protein n=1 Tax=Neobacillus niacini TaxID=86668 RepID=UPI0021CB05E1|nr:hypothetical protein [Neobacillus niacini]MCM3767951.1 hypothetical protein [Neobacillus niacini]